MWPDHCVQNTKGAELYPSLKRLGSDERIHKGINTAVDSYSAFYDNTKGASTGLTDVLRDAQVGEGGRALGQLRACVPVSRVLMSLLPAAQIERTFVCGLAYDVCVGFTALHSQEEGFETFGRLPALGAGIQRPGPRGRRGSCCSAPRCLPALPFSHIHPFCTCAGMPLRFPPISRQRRLPRRRSQGQGGHDRAPEEGGRQAHLVRGRARGRAARPCVARGLRRVLAGGQRATAVASPVVTPFFFLFFFLFFCTLRLHTLCCLCAARRAERGHTAPAIHIFSSFMSFIIHVYSPFKTRRGRPWWAGCLLPRSPLPLLRIQDETLRGRRRYRRHRIQGLARRPPREAPPRAVPGAPAAPSQ